MRKKKERKIETLDGFDANNKWGEVNKNVLFSINFIK